MIEKLLNIKKTSYSINLKQDNLRKKIEDVFEQRTLSLTGQFTSPNEFAAYDKWSIIKWYMPNLKRKSAYLTGKILKSNKGTLIKLNTKPNSILSIFAVFSVFIGIIITIISKSNIENNQFLIIGFIFIIVGIICYPIGIFLRNRLQNNFEKYLDIHQQ